MNVTKRIATAIFTATVAFTVVGCSSSPTKESTGEYIDDAAITAKVKTALAGDPRTKAHQVNVETREGVVQLSGFVDNSEAKSTAEELARSVDNVKSVDNQIDVKK